MVLIGRHEYLQNLRSDRALNALITILFDSATQIEPPQRIRQTSDAVVGIFAALQSGEGEVFTQAATMLSSRKISADSEWIYDDLLAFSFVIGVLRFGDYSELANQILRTRLTAGDEHSRAISESLVSLLKSGNDAPLASLLVVGTHLASPEKTLDPEILGNAFEQSLAVEMQPSPQQFLRLIGEKVVEIATAVSARANASEYSKLIEFRRAFKLRANIFAHSVFWILLVGSGVLWFWVARLYFSTDKASEEFAGKLFQMGVVVGPIALFLARRKVRSVLFSVFLRALGGSALLD